MKGGVPTGNEKFNVVSGATKLTTCSLAQVHTESNEKSLATYTSSSNWRAVQQATKGLLVTSF